MNKIEYGYVRTYLQKRRSHDINVNYEKNVKSSIVGPNKTTAMSRPTSTTSVDTKTYTKSIPLHYLEIS